MLVLTRKSEQSVIVGNAIEIKILGIKGDQVSLGFQAPRTISIYRKEIFEAIQKENMEAGRGRKEIANVLTTLGHSFLNCVKTNKEV